MKIYFELFHQSFAINLWVIIAIVLSFVAGMAFYHWLTFELMPNSFKLYSWWFSLRNHKRYGEPCKTDITIDRRGYSLGYNFEHRNALWVSYIVSRFSVGVEIDRRDEFYADEDIPEKYRVLPNDFRSSGFDKGHLAPYASVDFNHKSSTETFAMSNIALQNSGLNRKAWRSLENHIRNWTHEKGRLVIVTGPIFDGSPQKIKNISVPTAFYKVVYAPKHKRFVGFIFPNADVSAREIWNFAMPVSEVETKTGHIFYSSLSRRKQAHKTSTDTEWWKRKEI